MEIEYYTCDKCNGSGKIYVDIGLPKEYSSPITCDKCWGTGKLNWIENIFGKKYEVKIHPLDYLDLLIVHNNKYEEYKLSDFTFFKKYLIKNPIVANQIIEP